MASAGEDCKISLWMKNGQTVGVVPQPGEGTDDNIDVSARAMFCFRICVCETKNDKRGIDIYASCVHGTS